MEFNLNRRFGLVAIICVSSALVSSAQEFRVVVNFNGNDGTRPMAAPIQAFDGNLYGTTFQNGVNGKGTVYKMTPGGALTTVYNFCSQPDCVDGSLPSTSVLQSTNGVFYGLTSAGGVNDWGTIFKLQSATLMTLYSFCSQSNCKDGLQPNNLVQGADGNFYGTTFGGGANGAGIVFKMTPTGALTKLYDFCREGPPCSDGSAPTSLIQAADGNFFYGATDGGGASSDGTIFKITPTGVLTTLHSFEGADGAGPGALIQAANGKLYGLTQPFAAGVGTFFRFDMVGGTLETLYEFCSQPNCADGDEAAGLIQAGDSSFYGTTAIGGTGNGTVFKITARGVLTTLHTFSLTDGAAPFGLMERTTGDFYGTTYLGGSNGDGTVFGLSVGLRPFIKPVQSSGTVGSPVVILGTNLTGASSVTFNGAAATFRVVSSSEIETTVPLGATSGKIQVVTPQRTLSSLVFFRVR